MLRRDVLKRGVVATTVVATAGCSSSGDSSSGAESGDGSAGGESGGGSSGDSSGGESGGSSGTGTSGGSSEADAGGIGVDGTPGAIGRIALDVYNETSKKRTVSYSVSAGSNAVSEGSVEVPPKNLTSVPSKITNAGTYEVTVTVDGVGEGTRSFDLGAAALSTGADLSARIREDGVELTFG